MFSSNSSDPSVTLTEEEQREVEKRVREALIQQAVERKLRLIEAEKKETERKKWTESIDQVLKETQLTLPDPGSETEPESEPEPVPAPAPVPSTEDRIIEELINLPPAPLAKRPRIAEDSLRESILKRSLDSYEGHNFDELNVSIDDGLERSNIIHGVRWPKFGIGGVRVPKGMPSSLYQKLFTYYFNP